LKVSVRVDCRRKSIEHQENLITTEKGEKINMKNIIKLATLSFLLMFAGCVQSLNLLYTDQDLIFDSTKKV